MVVSGSWEMDCTESSLQPPGKRCRSFVPTPSRRVAAIGPISRHPVICSSAGSSGTPCSPVSVLAARGCRPRVPTYLHLIPIFLPR